ncbi:facilitated trehalose transporter Tret1-like [Battus philenor]|uniref:facilitated trehalose transporter Tret1-like n=1 Tax=Battus philenor TaxID=42288 RepID=UPI0035CFA7C9
MVYTITKSAPQARRRGGSVWKQYLISFLVNLPFLAHGAQNELLRAHAHLSPVIDSVDVPWSSATFIACSLFTAPLYSVIINRCGRKAGMYVVVLLQVVACVLPMAVETTAAVLLVQSAAAGAAAGGLVLALPVYVREISADSIRAATVALMAPMTSAGAALHLLLPMDHIHYLMIGVIALSLLVILLVPETPSYYVKVNRIEDAKTSKAKLMSLKSDDASVVDEVVRLQEESARARANGDLNILNILKNQIYRDAVKIGLVLSTCTALCGSAIFLDQDKVFAQLRADVDPHKMIVPLGMLVGGLLNVVLARFVERKYVLTAAFSLLVLSLGTLAVYMQEELTVSYLRWVPVAVLPVLVTSYGLLWSLPTVIMVEMFNLEIRAVAMGAVCAYTQALQLVQALALVAGEQVAGRHALLYMFAGVGLLGAAYGACAVPRLRAQTTRRVERQLHRRPIV